MVYGFVSSYEIIASWLADNRRDENDLEAYALDWIDEGLSLIDAPQSYAKLWVSAEIKDHQLYFPCGVRHLHEVRSNGCTLPMASPSGPGYTIDYACNKAVRMCVPQRTGNIDLHISQIPLDERGYPLVPDHGIWRVALKNYLETKRLYPKMLDGEVSPQIYQFMQAQWGITMTQASAVAAAPSQDMIESLKATWLNIVPQLERPYV